MMQLLQRAAELSVRDSAFLHANYAFINIIEICWAKFTAQISKVKGIINCNVKWHNLQVTAVKKNNAYLVPRLQQELKIDTAVNITWLQHRLVTNCIIDDY